MYLFYNLKIKSLERSHWCNSTAIIGSFNYLLRITYCWLWRPHYICLEQYSSRKCPKNFEASGIHCCILNNTQFLKTSHWNQKNFIRNVSVSKKMVYAKGTFVWWWLCIRSFRTIVYVVDKQSGICRRYILLQGLCVPGVKIQHMYETSLKWIFFFKFKWTVLNQINPNLDGFSRGSFLPPCFKETTLKTILLFEFAYVSCILYKPLL